ncbi:unnamed protein product [Aphanomyces euteiches]
MTCRQLWGFWFYKSSCRYDIPYRLLKPEDVEDQRLLLQAQTVMSALMSIVVKKGFASSVAGLASQPQAKIDRAREAAMVGLDTHLRPGFYVSVEYYTVVYARLQKRPLVIEQDRIPKTPMAEAPSRVIPTTPPIKPMAPVAPTVAPNLDLAARQLFQSPAVDHIELPLGWIFPSATCADMWLLWYRGDGAVGPLRHLRSCRDPISAENFQHARIAMAALNKASLDGGISASPQEIETFPRGKQIAIFNSALVNLRRRIGGTLPPEDAQMFEKISARSITCRMVYIAVTRQNKGVLKGEGLSQFKEAMAPT